MSTSLTKYKDEGEIGLSEGLEPEYVELRIPGGAESYSGEYGEILDEVSDYLHDLELDATVRVREDVNTSKVKHDPELLIGRTGEDAVMGFIHALSGRSIKTENVKAALNEPLQD